MIYTIIIMDNTNTVGGITTDELKERWRTAKAGKVGGEADNIKLLDDEGNVVQLKVGRCKQGYYLYLIDNVGDKHCLI